MPSFSTILANQSRDLETLSVAFLADALFFFHTRTNHQNWTNLRSLALTAKVLNSNHTAWAEELLVVAALVAKRMPKLQIMELWNCRRNNEACCFRYHSTKEFTAISWCGNWNFDIPPRVKRAWSEVVQATYPGRVLQVPEARILQQYLVQSPGDAIYYLDLQVQVVHPVSLDQMRREGKFYWSKYTLPDVL